MLKQLRPALVMIVAMTVITGFAYPFAITGAAQVLFPTQAQGSLVTRDGRVVGSALIGQTFADDRYFHSRPSATVATDPADASKTVPAPYNAANSGASNLAPTNKALLDRVQEDIKTAKGDNATANVPMDLVTTSASGLDPDITPEAALFQAPRVARVRGIAEDRVRQLISARTQQRFLGILGESQVNVLALNLALDGLE